MNVIEELKAHEENELSAWLNTDEKSRRKFLRELATFTSENSDELKRYCTSVNPGEFSSLSIVYEALSNFSVQVDFLLDEIRRIVGLAKNGNIPPERLSILQDIDLEDIYSKKLDSYVQIMHFLFENLQLSNVVEFNLELLDLINWYLIDLDEDDEIPEVKNWFQKLRELANYGELSVKLKARDVLENAEEADSLRPLSFLEKIMKIFK